MTNEEKPAAASLWFGVGLICVALFFLGFAGSIERLGLSDDNDPGPRAFPIALSLILLAGGLVQVVQGWPRVRRPPDDGAAVEPTTPESRKNVLLLVVGLSLYLAVVPWLGFDIPTFVFVALLSWTLGARWWSSLLTACVLIIVIRALFVGLFRVQLPPGVFG